jgi:hypothetical protein
MVSRDVFYRLNRVGLGSFDIMADFEPQEGKMIPQVTGTNGRSQDRVVPITSAKNKKQANGQTKVVARPGRDQTTEVGLSKRIVEAFKEDTDPTKSLAEIRDLLMGPVSRVHEARMEELISILEEADRNSQDSARDLHARCDGLAKTCEHLIAALNDTNDLLQRQSEQHAAELQKQAKTHANEIEEMTKAFDGKVHKLASDQAFRMDALSTKTANDYEALVINFTTRIEDLAHAASANDERIIANFEAALVQAEENAEHLRSKQIETFADGFNVFADRMMTLRGAKVR